MPTSRTLVSDLATVLRDLYADAQLRIATDVARRLAQGIDTPDWAQEKLIGLTVVRHQVETILRRLDTEQAPMVEQLLTLAYVRGASEAVDELARLAGGPAGAARELAALNKVRATLPGNEAVNRLVFSLVSMLRGTHVRILRTTIDAYRTTVATAGTVDVLLGTATRLQAAQRVWEKFLTDGITGFVDRSGRRWELASYVEMATRTATAQAAVQAHLDRLTADGHDLVICSDAPQECALCRPWEGKVLSATGRHRRGWVVLPHAARDDMTVRVFVAGTVAQAIAAGLMHPNCRHSLSLYLPGVTRIPTDTADTAGDAARQRQREIERAIRQWKLRAAAGLDPAAKRRAEAKVREWQATLRAHLAEHPEVRRLPARERIGVAR